MEREASQEARITRPEVRLCTISSEKRKVPVGGGCRGKDEAMGQWVGGAEARTRRWGGGWGGRGKEEVMGQWLGGAEARTR